VFKLGTFSRWLDDVVSKVDNAQEIEMALWFHDAVYEPFSASNEEDSAEWAADWLQERGANKAVISRIADHILDTKSHDKPKTLDGQYMLDIDLSILGTRPAVYDEYEINIRREYKRVPSFIFKKKRKTILQSFLARDRIYTTDYFHDKLEKRRPQTNHFQSLGSEAPLQINNNVRLVGLI